MKKKDLNYDVYTFSKKILMIIQEELNNPNSERSQQDDYSFIIGTFCDATAHALVVTSHCDGRDINNELELFNKILKMRCEQLLEVSKKGLN